MGTEEMRFNETRYADVVVLEPQGRLDQESSETFQNQLLTLISDNAAPQANMVLDMSGVNYISSVGLRALMVVAKQCSASNGKLALANLSPVVLEIFEISRFNLIIDVHSDVAAALVAISPDAAAAYAADH
jgi:anti-sigma B factor antagonist/stage II sporulation protein AA (anti-sigma F factor antagonist)